MNKIKKIIKEHEIIRQAFLYGIIGVISSSIDSITFILLRKISVGLLLANFIGINVGITISFLCNTFINFKQKDHLIKRAFSFFSVGYIGLCISMLIMFIFADKLGFDEIIVKIVSIVIVAIIQFILNKLITYRKKDVLSNS